MDAATTDARELSEQLVRNDGLKYKRIIFDHPIIYDKEVAEKACSIGTAYVYSLGRFAFRNPDAHFARAALVLPKDYKSRLVAYFIVGHQFGGGLVNEEQAEYLERIILGLREKQG